MALVNRSFSVYVAPVAMPPIVHVSEYDVGRAYTVGILDEQGNMFTIPSGTTASIEGTLNGSVGFTQSATISNNQVSFTLSQSMTAYSGKAWCKIKLTQNSQPIQTCAFVLAVDRAGVEAETVIGAPGFEGQIQQGVADYLDEHQPFFTLPEGGEAGQALVSDGEGGVEWSTGEDDTTTITTVEPVSVSWSTIQDNWIDKSKNAISVGQSDGFKYFDKTVSQGEKYILTSCDYWDLARVVFYNSSNAIVSVLWTSGGEGTVETDTEFTIASGVTRMRLQSWQSYLESVDLRQIVTETVSKKSAAFVNYKNGETVEDALDRLDEEVGTYISRLKGMKIAYNGDSICEERLTGSMANGGAYPKLISTATGCVYHNIARGGATFATGTSASHIISTSVSDMAADADIVCFEGGINDFFANVPIGTLSDSYTSTLDTTTLTGAIESIIRQAIQKWSDVPIVWVIVHKFDTTWTSANQNGDTYQDYRDAIIAVLNKYAIPYYDCALLSGLSNQNATQRSLYMFDGEHPKESGYKMFYVPQLISLFESVLPY